jgi:hypothetical protein
MYDPVIGRFHSQDPMAVFTPGISPYAYAEDNPILYIDEYGLGWVGNLLRSIKDLFSSDDRCFCPKQKTSNDTGRRAKKSPHKRVRSWPNSSSPSSSSSSSGTSTTPVNLDPLTPISGLITNEFNPTLAPSVPVIPSPNQGFVNYYIKSGENDDEEPEATEISGHITFKVQTYEIDLTNPANVDFLNKVIVTLIEYPQMIIEISSNTADFANNIPKKVYERTSNMRAGAIIEYLRRMGVKNILIPTTGKHIRGGDSKRTTTFKRVE